MSDKPVFKKFSNNPDEYLEQLKKYLKLNIDDNNAKADLLSFYAKTRNDLKFEEGIQTFSDIKNFHIQAQIARYFIFKKGDVDAAQNCLEKCVKINKESPMWVYYYLGRSFNYYEKLCPGILYTAIPKNGSTSLKNFILDKVYAAPERNPHSQFGNPFFKSHHYSDKELSESKKLLVIRDPISRIKSYFNKNVVEEKSLSFELGLDSKEKEFYGLPLVPSFDFFLENLWDYCWVFNDVLHHILPQSAYIKNVNDYDVVVDLKSLDYMVKKVSDYIGLNYVGPAPHKMVPSKKAEDRVTLHDEYLYKIYSDDYRLLEAYYSFGLEFRPENGVSSFSPINKFDKERVRMVDVEFFKKHINGFFNGDMQALGFICSLSHLNENEMAELIDQFDAEVSKDLCNVDMNDKSQVLDLDEFLLGVVEKVRFGVSELQDCMLKESKLQISVGHQKVSSDKTLILSPHLFALPFLYDNNIYFVFFAGFNSQIVAVFNLKEMSYTSFVYQKNQKPPVDRVLPSNVSVKLLLKHIFDFRYELFNYATKISQGRGVILTAQHMGHSLWNDLTGMQRIEDNGLIKLVRSFVVLKGADPYGVMQNGFDIRKDLELVRYSYLQWKEQIANFYYNNLFWIRVTDNYVSNSLAEKVIGSPVNKGSCPKNEVSVAFGLRMENRTWENQKEGWLAIIRCLEKSFKKVTIIIDGHNKSNFSGVLRSAGETQEHSIVNKEKELVEYLKSQSYSAEVSIISCIESTLIHNVRVLNKCDFFIAPWGAGLAKMKWICNLPGVVLTSNWNLKSRPDLRIYDSPEYRENAIESVFLDSRYIDDIGNESALVKSELAQKHNFLVDLDGLLLTVETLIKDLGAKDEF